MSDRPTPETDAAILAEPFPVREIGFEVVKAKAMAAMERQRDEARELARELRDALIAISTNPHLDLQDKIYDVRDREGEGWDGPSVTAWNNACRSVDAALAKAKDYLP